MEQTDVPDNLGTALDTITFVGVLIVSVIFGGLIFCLLSKRNYAPLRARNVTQLVFSLIFGAIHIWGTFIANDHFQAALDLQKKSCAFWNFWFQYFFGFTIWYIIFVLRQEMYIWSFWKMAREISKFHNIFIQIAICLFFVAPSSIIFGMITALGGIKWNEDIGRCETALEWEYIVLGWVIFCILIIVGLNIAIKFIVIWRFYSEYEPINAITNLSMAVIAINGIIIIFDLLIFPLGRAISTFMIIYFHVYSFLAIAWKDFWNAIRNNLEYEKRFTQSMDASIIGAKDFKTFVKVDEGRADFLDYVKDKDPVTLKSPIISGGIVITPKYYVECYYQMVKWKTEHAESIPEVNLNTFETIYETYMIKTSPRYINIPPNFIVMSFQKVRETKKRENPLPVTLNSYVSYQHTNPPVNIFDDVIGWIPLELGKYWGDVYIKTDMFRRPFYSALVEKKYMAQGADDNMNRLKQLKLLSQFGMDAEGDDVELVPFDTELVNKEGFVSMDKFNRRPLYEDD